MKIKCSSYLVNGLCWFSWLRNAVPMKCSWFSWLIKMKMKMLLVYVENKMLWLMLMYQNLEILLPSS
jgi:hypothetical protein